MDAIVRYFINYSDKEEPTLLTTIKYNNQQAIIPNKGDRLFLTDLFDETLDDKYIYSYYVVESVDYCFDRKGVMIDILVIGAEWE